MLIYLSMSVILNTVIVKIVNYLPIWHISLNK